MKLELLQQIEKNTEVLPELKIAFIIFMLMVFLILLGILLASLTITDYITEKKPKVEPEEAPREYWDEAVQRAIRALTVERAEIDEWVSRVIGDGEINPDTLVAEIKKRNKALAIKLAGEELEKAQADRAYFENEISQAQRRIREKGWDQDWVRRRKSEIMVYAEQCDAITARIEVAKKRLSELAGDETEE